MRKKFFMIGGGLLAATLLVTVLFVNWPAQNANVQSAAGEKNPTQPANTSAPNMPLPTDIPYTISEVERAAGFDVQEPAYLPAGASFVHAAYQNSPRPRVTLH